MRFLMQSWAQAYWRDVAQARGDEGKPFRYSASNQFPKVGLRSGDRIYVVGNADGELLLIGRMNVARVVPRHEAVRLTGNGDLFPRNYVAIAQEPLCPLSFKRRVPEIVARAIRGENGKRLKLDETQYRLDPMALLSARFLSSESAAALDLLIDE